MSRKRGDGLRTFHAQNVAADILLLVVLLPLGVAAFTFLFLIPVTLVAALAGIDSDRAVLAWAGVPALILCVLIARRKLFWSIALDRDVLLVGKLWPYRVPYDRIRYISSGKATDAVASVGKQPRASIPFVFATGVFAERRLFLRRDDSEQCLRELYARCPNAGAIDADGNVFLPRNAAALPFARIRLAETLMIRGITAISTAMVAVLLRLVPLRANTLHEVAASLRVVSLWWLIYPLIPGLLAYGWSCLRQMRRVLRGGMV